MDDPVLQFSVSKNIAYLTINSPPKNELRSEFFSILGKLAQDTLVNCNVLGMIVSGAGRHFSTGANVEELLSLSNSNPAITSKPDLFKNTENFSVIETLPYPVVAAITGCCFGAGLELALACHFRIASSHAVFALPESEFGLMPGCGGTIRLPHLIGQGKAIKMIMSGKSMLADDALKIGLIDLVTEKINVMPAAKRFIRNSGLPAVSKVEK